MAASNHIEIASSPRVAGRVRYAVDSARQLAEVLVELSDILSQLNLDGPAALAGALGISSEDDAAMVHALIASASGELAAAPFFNQLVDRLG